ncbi:MAG: hypothetical protein U0791_18975 [Gemmataceae bacterium]
MTFEELEGRVVPAAISWVGGASQNWGDAANWSPAQVPTASDSVTINKASPGTINVNVNAFAQTINDTTAPLSILTGSSLTLSATTSPSVFGQSVTVQAGASLIVGAGAPVTIGPSPTNGGTFTLAVNGTLSFASGDTVTLATTYNTTTQITVGSGEFLTANGTTFNSSIANGGTTQIVVGSGGRLQAANSTFAVGQVNLNVGAVVNAGDLSGNAFDSPLYIPAIAVQYLSGTGNNNLRFQSIYLQPDTLTTGQSVALNAIGTQTTNNLRYVFPGSFTINSGATLAVGANVPVTVGPSPSNGGTMTLAVNGTLSFASGDTVTLNATTTYNTTTQITVGSGGLLTANGTTFNASIANGGYTQIVVGSGGRLQSTGSTYSIGQLNFNIGAVVNAGDLSGNAFDSPLYIPAIAVQYLSGTGNNNLRFQSIYLQPDTLTNGQSVALDAIGTQTTNNLRYVFPGSFTINSGATLAVGANVPVTIGPSPSNGGTMTLAVNGTLSFASGDTVTLNAVTAYNTTTQITVGSGGLLTANGTTFNASIANGGFTQIVVGSGGRLQSTGSTFAVGQVNLNSGVVFNPGDLANNAFDCALYVPALNVQYLSGSGNDNKRFQAIYVGPASLTNGQSVALNAIGTQSTTNLNYVVQGSFILNQGSSLTVASGVPVAFAGNFTINSGATLAVGANAPVTIGPSPSNGGTLTMAVNGTLSFAASNTVTLNATTAYNTMTQITVGSGGLLTANGTTFNASVANGGYTQVVVASGDASSERLNTFAVGQLNFNVGAVVNAGDLSGNAFDSPLYIPSPCSTSPARATTTCGSSRSTFSRTR